MRRRLVVIVAGLILSGCASSKPAQTASCPRRYLPAVAGALAFDPPVGAGTPDLSRADRGPEAFGGFQSLTTEYYDVQTYDNQQYYDRGGSNYSRQVIGDRFGVIVR